MDENPVVTIACVLKSGGDYTSEYVEHLRNAVTQTFSCKHDFVCLSDIAIRELQTTDIHARQMWLRHDLPSWWSKLEFFRLSGPVITFDLDLVPVNDCTELCNIAVNLEYGTIVMLGGLRREPWNSSIMIWNGNYEWMLRRFLSDYDFAKHIVNNRGHHLEINQTFFHGDQEYIVPTLQQRKIQMTKLQDVFIGVYSYKDNIRDKQDLPRDAKIVCFHGKPRPHKLPLMPQWMQQYGWKGKVLKSCEF